MRLHRLTAPRLALRSALRGISRGFGPVQDELLAHAHELHGAGAVWLILTVSDGLRQALCTSSGTPSRRLAIPAFVTDASCSSVLGIDKFAIAQICVAVRSNSTPP